MTATEEEIILHIYKNNYKSLEVLYVISESSLSGYFPKEWESKISPQLWRIQRQAHKTFGKIVVLENL